VRDPDAGDGAPAGGRDKRRLVLESEFAQVLKVLAREGNTLSPVIRNAWDGKTLQTIAKNTPVRARDAHIAIVGHITKDELLRYITRPSLPRKQRRSGCRGAAVLRLLGAERKLDVGCAGARRSAS
jgi:hypothetical protein